MSEQQGNEERWYPPAWLTTTDQWGNEPGRNKAGWVPVVSYIFFVDLLIIVGFACGYGAAGGYQ